MEGAGQLVAAPTARGGRLQAPEEAAQPFELAEARHRQRVEAQQREAPRLPRGPVQEHGPAAAPEVAQQAVERRVAGHARDARAEAVAVFHGKGWAGGRRQRTRCA